MTSGASFPCPEDPELAEPDRNRTACHLKHYVIRGRTCVREGCGNLSAAETPTTQPALAGLCWHDRKWAALFRAKHQRWPDWMPQSCIAAGVQSVGRMIADRLLAKHGNAAETEALKLLEAL